MQDIDEGNPGDRRHTLTRREVAAKLGVSTSSVRRMEFATLHPEEDENGVWRFDPAEVERIPARAHVTEKRRRSAKAVTLTREGKLAARVFRMFARNWTLPQIVVATNQPPNVIRTLYHEWSTSLQMAEWGGQK